MLGVFIVTEDTSKERGGNVAEKIITYEVKLLVSHHNNQHIKKFEKVLLKMLQTGEWRNTKLATVNQMK